MLYWIMLSLPILALSVTQDGSSGQDNGPERRELIDGVVVRYEPGTSGNQRQGGAGFRGEKSRRPAGPCGTGRCPSPWVCDWLAGPS